MNVKMGSPLDDVYDNPFLLICSTHDQIFVVNLPYFQEEVMIKEDSIKIGGKKLGKEADKENSVAVDRPAITLNGEENMA